MLCCIQDDDERGAEPTSHEVGIDVGAEALASQTSQSGGSIQSDGPSRSRLSQTDGPSGPRLSQTDGPSGPRLSQTDGPSQMSQTSAIGVSMSSELEGASQSSTDIEVRMRGTCSVHGHTITPSPPHSRGEGYYVPQATPPKAPPTLTSQTHSLTPHREQRDSAPPSPDVPRWPPSQRPNQPAHRPTRPTSQ